MHLLVHPGVHRRQRQLRLGHLGRQHEVPDLLGGAGRSPRGLREEHGRRWPDPGRLRTDRRVVLDDDQCVWLLPAHRAGRDLRRHRDEVRLRLRRSDGPGRHRRCHDGRSRHPPHARRHLRGRRLRYRGRARVAALGEGRGPPGRDPRPHGLHLAVERVLRDPRASQRLHLRVHRGLDVPGIPERGPPGHDRRGRPDPELLPPGRLGQPRLQLLPAGRHQRGLQRRVPAARLDGQEPRGEPEQRLEEERPVGSREPDGRHGLLGRRRLRPRRQRLRALQHRALVAPGPDAGRSA